MISLGSLVRRTFNFRVGFKSRTPTYRVTVKLSFQSMHKPLEDFGGKVRRLLDLCQARNKRDRKPAVSRSDQRSLNKGVAALYSNHSIFPSHIYI